MKEIEDDTNRWKDILCTLVRRIKIVKMTILSQAIYRFNAILIKISMAFYTEREQIILKFVWKQESPQIGQNNLEKEEQSWRNHTP